MYYIMQNTIKFIRMTKIQKLKLNTKTLIDPAALLVIMQYNVSIF